jgi:hypothetical protein
MCEQMSGGGGRWDGRRCAYLNATKPGTPVFSPLSEGKTVWPNDDPIEAETAWDRIATARAIVTDATGCSADAALRAMKECADDRGDPIGTFAAALIGEASWRTQEKSGP